MIRRAMGNYKVANGVDVDLAEAGCANNGFGQRSDTISTKKQMRAPTRTSLLWLALVATGFGGIGEDEKQIEARYGKPGKDMGTHGDVHEFGYLSGGFMILVDFVNGISQREGFANPDTSPLSPESVELILRMSAPEGTSWHSIPSTSDDRSWQLSGYKTVDFFTAGVQFR